MSDNHDAASGLDVDQRVDAIPKKHQRPEAGTRETGSASDTTHPPVETQPANAESKVNHSLDFPDGSTGSSKIDTVVSKGDAVAEGHVATISDSTSTQEAGSSPSNGISSARTSNLAPENTPKTETTTILQVMSSQLAALTKTLGGLSARISIVELQLSIQQSQGVRVQSSKFLNTPQPTSKISHTPLAMSAETSKGSQPDSDESQNLTHHSLVPVGGRNLEETSGDEGTEGSGSDKDDDKGNGSDPDSTPPRQDKGKTSPPEKPEKPSTNPPREAYKHTPDQLRRLDIVNQKGAGRARKKDLKSSVGLTLHSAKEVLINWFITEMEERNRRQPTIGFTARALLELAISHLDQAFVDQDHEVVISLKGYFLMLIGKVLGYPKFSADLSSIGEVNGSTYFTSADFNAKLYKFKHRGEAVEMTWPQAIEDLFIKPHLEVYFHRTNSSTDQNAVVTNLTNQCDEKEKEVHETAARYHFNNFQGVRLSMLLSQIEALFERLDALGEDFTKLQQTFTTKFRKAAPDNRVNAGIWYQLGLEATRALRNGKNLWKAKYQGKLVLELLRQKEDDTLGVHDELGSAKTQLYGESKSNGNQRKKKTKWKPHAKKHGKPKSMDSVSTNGIQAALNACAGNKNAGTSRDTGGAVTQGVMNAICACIELGPQGNGVLAAMKAACESPTLSTGQMNSLNAILSAINSTYEGNTIAPKISKGIAAGRKHLAMAKAYEFSKMYSSNATPIRDPNGMNRFLQSHKSIEDHLKSLKTSAGEPYFNSSKKVGSQWISNIPKDEYLAMPDKNRDMLRILRLWHNFSREKIQDVFTPYKTRYGANKYKEMAKRVGGNGFDFGKRKSASSPSGSLNAVDVLEGCDEYSQFLSFDEYSS